MKRLHTVVVLPKWPQWPENWRQSQPEAGVPVGLAHGAGAQEPEPSFDASPGHKQGTESEVEQLLSMRDTDVEVED